MLIEEANLKEGELPLNKVIHGNALTVLKKLPSNSVDSVVTDPPYGLKFMNQKWDYDVPSVELWKEVLRVLKPGGHLLSFFGTRTYHRGVINIEDAGFEIRDMIQWIYGEGFPKSMDVSKAIDKEFGKLEERVVIGLKPNIHSWKAEDNTGNTYGKYGKKFDEVSVLTAPATPEAEQWQGWGTALKPACEPIVLARKPISEKNIAQNVLRWGTGGLNISACRISLPKNDPLQNGVKHNSHKLDTHGVGWGFKAVDRPAGLGRYPANVILDEEAAKMLDEQSGIVKRNNKVYSGYENKFDNAIFSFGNGAKDRIRVFADSGGASRFFYCAKAGRDERFAYCHDCNEVLLQAEWEKHKDHNVEFHPTVKPLKLIEYLVRLVTPPNGIVLDPFMGTGTSGIAALKQGFRFIGIEIRREYCEIAIRRIKNTCVVRRLTEYV